MNLNPLKVPASTPVAEQRVVLLNNQQTKLSMEAQLRKILIRRGLKRHHTQVGQDVICRVGDPCEMEDLLRVNAHQVTSCLC